MTGHLSVPSGDREEIIRLLGAIYEKKARETASYLRPFWLAVRSAKTKDGRPYNTMRPTWLDWAAVGVIPEYVLRQLSGNVLAQMGKALHQQPPAEPRLPVRSDDETPEQRRERLIQEGVVLYGLTRAEAERILVQNEAEANR